MRNKFLVCQGAILWCLLLLAPSCMGTKTEWMEDNSFDYENAPSIVLRAEKEVSSYNYLFAQKFYVYADSILVITNQTGQGHATIQLADLKTGQMLNQTLLYGNGPREVLQAMTHRINDVLYVDDFARSRLYEIELDQFLKQGVEYQPRLALDYGQNESSFVTRFDNQHFLALNPYCFEDEAIGISNEGQDRFFFVPSQQKEDKDIIHREYDTYNVSQGYLIPNKEKNRIIFASSSLPLIEIYDASGEKIKRLKGPKSLPVRYAVGEGGHVAFSGDIPYAYQGFCCFDESLYLNFIGDFLGKGYGNLKSTILQMDWDGNILCAFLCPVYLSSFSVTSDGTIYGQGFDENNTHVLWKLTQLNDSE